MQLRPLTYYPMHMHLHASHEPSASIGSHMSHAASLGIRHLWLTEHDSRMGQKGKRAMTGFAFSKPTLYEEERRAGFLEDENNNGAYAFVCDGESVYLQLQAEENQKESVYFKTGGKQHCDALFSDLKITLNADMVAANNGSVVVEFVLSAQPPSYEQARLRYVLGQEIPKEENLPIKTLPMPKAQNGQYTFPITQDADESVGGLDNAFCSVRLWVQNGASFTFNRMDFSRRLNFEKVRQEQVKIAKALGEKWGVTPFVAFEITKGGHHKNCYSTKVPVIDYIGLQFNVTNEMAVEHVKKHGGIFSWNHPFTENSGKGLSQEERDAIVQEVAKKLIETRVYGATLLEVGFPVGRDGMSLERYLRLWDTLTEHGILITGDGDSDCHHADESGWTEGNNFCTYAGLYADETPTEENFVKAFKRGSVWIGNPVKMQSFTFFAKNVDIGGVAVGERIMVNFSAESKVQNGYARCIVNGKEVKRLPMVNGRVSGRFWLCNKQAYNFARVELYDADGVGIGLTNPIYLVGSREILPLEVQENGRI